MTMPPSTQPARAITGWHLTANWIGALSGVVTCGVVLWQGGRLANQIEVNSARLNRLEVDGSPALLAHARFDQAETDAIRQRIDRLENAVLGLGKLEGRLASIEAKMESLTEVMKLHRETLAAFVREQAAKDTK